MARKWARQVVNIQNVLGGTYTLHTTTVPVFEFLKKYGTLVQDGNGGAATPSIPELDDESRLFHKALEACTSETIATIRDHYLLGVRRRDIKSAHLELAVAITGCRR